MTLRQWRRWCAFLAAEPVGAEASWQRAATIAACVLNAAPGRRPGAPAIEPRELMPDFAAGAAAARPAAPAGPVQSQREIRRALRRMLGPRIKLPKERPA